MALYDYECSECGWVEEVLSWKERNPLCCGKSMKRIYRIRNLRIKMGYPMWIDRIEEIHKRQQDRGETLRLVHPSEVL